LSGSVDEGSLADAYRSARLFAYVSTSEGFGLPLLEAFAARVPVVASDAGALPEVGGDAAVYASPTDEGQIADALSRGWHDEDLRRALVACGLARLDAFSWEATARATVTVYRDVLKGESI
jgi:glycosyltransferase involved in cell wall biosynthesis